MAFSGVSVTTVDYLGELFLQRKRPNALLGLLGGIQGSVKTTTSKEFPIGAFYTLPAPSQPARLEGAAAPAPNNTSITQTTNVIQIFQEAVSLTYLAMSERSIAGVVPIPQGDVNGPVQNPRTQEFQVMRTLEKIAQDANYSFLNGQYNNPGDPSTGALATRGILTSISTNVFDRSATTLAAAQAITAQGYRAWINNALESMIQYNGYAIDETFVAIAGAAEYQNIAAAWSNQGTIYIMPEAMVFGVKVRKIFTTFGTVLLALDPDVESSLSTTIATGHAVTAADTTAFLTSVTGLVVGDSLNFDTAGTIETFAITAINAGTGVVTINGAFADNHAAGAIVTRSGQIGLLNLGQCGVVGAPVPEKGNSMLFEEPLYKQGSSEQTQIYGQLGVDHGPEYLHGLVKVPYGVAIAQ